MICPICGSMLPDNTKFCGACGSAMQQGYGLVQQPYQAYQPYQQPFQYQGYQPQQQFQQPPQVAPQEPQQPQPPDDYVVTDPTSAVKQAWSDVKALDGWFKRLLLLMVMRSLPILSYFTIGYELRWAVGAWRDVPKELPRGAFNKDAFLTGLFYAILTLLCQIGTAWLVVCNIIPIAGTILWIVLLIQVTVFTALAAMRMTMFNRFGAAFDMSEVFKKLRTKSTGLFKAYLIPWLICIGIAAIMYFVSVVITALIGMVFSAGISNAGNANFFMMVTASLAQVMWLLVIFMVVSTFCAWFLMTLAEIWSFRSLAYWVGYYGYDWICEAHEEGLKKR